jgi:hypothetical protein
LRNRRTPKDALSSETQRERVKIKIFATRENAPETGGFREAGGVARGSPLKTSPMREV